MKEDPKRLIIQLGPLKTGHTETIEERVQAPFFEAEDEFISFTGDILLTGEAYVADDTFVLHLSIEGTAVVPCSICSEKVASEVKLEGLYHAIPLSEIHGSYFDMKDFVRENLFLEAPEFIECSGGTCPKRKELKKYFKEKTEEGYHPFSDLKLE